jgi:hypothetical protein
VAGPELGAGSDRGWSATELTRRVARASAAGFAVGSVIGGIVGRLAMRLLAITSDDHMKACSPMTTRGSTRRAGRHQFVGVGVSRATR